MAYKEALAWFEETMKSGPCKSDCPQCNSYILAIEALKNNVWISVKEALPERFLNVLVTDGEYVSIGAYQSGKRWCVEDFDIADDGGVKFWMPIPEPPRKERANA